ncbi:hypothetical protein EA658_04445 [Pseudoxanthomonas winnipegensis]|jgi:predicted dienelactone hydrolase|uniref:Serine aminopeptidase S33 domain-containing protein n=1 Tax=Pseudoxanthomonas winnipegensis TaxID=2480810 RepID=A0ABY1WJD3_9GAMM|nr:alpha/beta hydrolase [Pseudoxanthomonas winnipegensis]TAA09793.1 hypothetical protein EA659_09470 [Pseudoxanthomonas winnipegensis]TAA22827.1 hypothetical protein EA658_04445 [Pseudoxanthomonas winnipegensis]TAH73239.1 hypothetical protein EA657_05985 [Pseudoxanthomonas winnipegensis]
MTLLRLTSLIVLTAGLALGARATAGTAGEAHRLAHVPSAALRNADHRDDVRITVWYPAAPGAAETPVQIGPPGAPLFESGRAASDAPVAPGRFPVVLFSHGNGGSARMMAWFGTALARAGYVVIAVDHPGNNGVDAMTVAGSTLVWERADDLRAALALVRQDPVLGPHLDTRHMGVAGFSLGGFTALLALGARADLGRLIARCHADPQEAACLPQAEAPELTLAAREAALKRAPLAAEAARSGDDHAIRGLQAAFLMAPGAALLLAPDSLTSLDRPVAIVGGEADTVAPLASDGRWLAERLPQATLTTLPRVGHYDFLGRCTRAGVASIALCQHLAAPQEATHASAIRQAIAFFDARLKVERP